MIPSHINQQNLNQIAVNAREKICYNPSQVIGQMELAAAAKSFSVTVVVDFDFKEMKVALERMGHFSVTLKEHSISTWIISW